MVQLHARREKIAETGRREAAGEDLWTDHFSGTARTRLWSILDLLGQRWGDNMAGDIQQTFRMQLGVTIPLGWGWSSIADYFMNAPDNLLPSLVEAILDASDRAQGPSDELPSILAAILAEERIAFDLIDGQMVAIKSRELHQEVVAPALRLLGGRAGWEGVETAYQDALEEIGKNAADSITDSGRALEEALKARGCAGNALGPRLKDAKKKGILAPHDSPMLDAIVGLVNWVSSDRSALGDAHPGGPPTRDDAWLAVHVVGAVILRLAAGSDRPQP